MAWQCQLNNEFATVVETALPGGAAFRRFKVVDKDEAGVKMREPCKSDSHFQAHEGYYIGATSLIQARKTAPSAPNQYGKTARAGPRI
jgi:hypothetical protein